MTGTELEQTLKKAQTALGKGELEEALPLLSSALDATNDPRLACRIRNTIGAILMQLHRYTEALPHLSQAAKEPNGRPHGPGLYNLGLCLLKLERFHQAFENLEEFVSLQPKNPHGWHNLAMAARELGRLSEAEAAARKATELAPEWPQAWNGLGVVLELRDRPADAEAALRKALALAPGHLAASYNLGCLLHGLERQDEAASLFEDILSKHPEHEGARFMLQVQGRLPQPEKAPSSFVQATFDSCATVFEKKLLADLAYKTPEELYQRVAPLLGSGLSILDLGCGTGLGAQYYRQHAKVLSGMDCSKKMLDQAKAKGIYDRLYLQDLLAPWPRELHGLDLVYSSDCLVYFGDLAPVLSMIDKHLVPKGVLAFSLELLDGDEAQWRLHHSGRYAHSQGYIGELLYAHGFEPVVMDPVILRHEAGRPVRGMIVVARSS